MSDDLKENVQNTAVWKRLIYMLLFSIFYWVAKVVMIAVIVFQFVLALFTGKNDNPVKRLGSQLSAYIYQVFRFLTYNTETQPFPFSDWPSGDELVEASSEKVAAKARRRPTTKRKPAKKKVETTEETNEIDSDQGDASKVS